MLSRRVNTIINSGPGTGKTEYMKRSIQESISCGMKEEEIIGFTFTNAAAREMKDRLSMFEGLKIQNMHSFCIQELNHTINIIPDDLSISLANLLQDKQEAEATPSYKGAKVSKYNITSSRILKALSEWRDYIFRQAEFMTFEDYVRMTEDESLITNAVYATAKDPSNETAIKFQAKLFKRAIHLLRKMREYGYTDFYDVIIEGYFKIELPDIKYILVDEFQDLTYPEYRLMTSLSSQAKYLFLCDTNQGIYFWRGSTFEENVQHFKENFSELKEMSLNKNFRCSKQVLELTNNLTNKNDKLGFTREGSVTYCDPSSNLRYIVDSCRNLQEGESLAILTQTNALASTIARDLKIEKIPTHHKFSKSFDKICSIRLLVKLLHFIHTPFSTPALTALCLDTYTASKQGVELLDALNLTSKSLSSEIIMYGQKSPLVQTQPGETYVIFDTETTGTDIEADDIIQIAGIKLNSDLEEIDRLNIYLKTDKPLATSEQVHHISKEVLEAQGLEREEGLSKALDFFKGSVMVAHNTAFDMNILLQNCKRCSPNLAQSLDNEHWVDTLDLVRVHLAEQGLANYKLETLASTLGFNTTPNHNAMFDVEATVELFRYIIHYVRKELELNKSLLLKDSVYMRTVYEYYSNFLNSSIYDIINFCETLVDQSNMTELTFWKSTIDLFEFFIFKGFTVTTMLDYFQLKSDTYDDRAKNKIVVSTVHQSKGLEFDKVIYVQERNSTDAKDIVNVENIAVSRAKKDFILLLEPKVTKSRIRAAIRKLQSQNEQATPDSDSGDGVKGF